MGLFGKDRHGIFGAEGFTLLEIVIVMVLIGLVASLGLPRFLGSIERAEIKTSARKIASAMRSAKSYAVSEKKTVTLVVDRKNMRVFALRGNISRQDKMKGKQIAEAIRLSDSVKIWADDSGAGKAQKTARGKKLSGVAKIANGFEEDAEEKPLYAVFSPRGTSTGGVIYVTPRDSIYPDDEKGYLIELNPLTGKAVVYPSMDDER